MKPGARVSHKINVQFEPPFQRWVDASRIRTTARAALRHQNAPACELTVRIAGDEALQALNRDFMGFDQATDVLSFPADEIDPATQRRYAGDIAISYPRARAQALEGRHAIWAELALLVVHGVLHLIGHDHATAEDQERMWAAQAGVLASLGAPISGPKER